MIPLTFVQPFKLLPCKSQNPCLKPCFSHNFRQNELNKPNEAKLTWNLFAKSAVFQKYTSLLENQMSFHIGIYSFKNRYLYFGTLSIISRIIAHKEKKWLVNVVHLTVANVVPIRMDAFEIIQSNYAYWIDRGRENCVSCVGVNRL